VFPDLGWVKSLPSENNDLVSLMTSYLSALVRTHIWWIRSHHHLSDLASRVNQPFYSRKGRNSRPSPIASLALSSPSAQPLQPAPTAHERSGRPDCGGSGRDARTGPLEAGVVVLVTVLVGGTCMQLRHRNLLLSGLHSKLERLLSAPLI
jgi:hypothetical protein